MVARPSKDQTSHKSLMKPALNALWLPTGRPGNPEGLPDCPGFHWVALLISVMSGTCFQRRKAGTKKAPANGIRG